MSEIYIHYRKKRNLAEPQIIVTVDTEKQGITDYSKDKFLDLYGIQCMTLVILKDSRVFAVAASLLVTTKLFRDCNLLFN